MHCTTFHYVTAPRCIHRIVILMRAFAYQRRVQSGRFEPLSSLTHSHTHTLAPIKSQMVLLVNGCSIMVGRLFCTTTDWRITQSNSVASVYRRFACDPATVAYWHRHACTRSTSCFMPVWDRIRIIMLLLVLLLLFEYLHGMQLSGKLRLYISTLMRQPLSRTTKNNSLLLRIWDYELWEYVVYVYDVCICMYVCMCIHVYYVCYICYVCYSYENMLEYEKF